MWIDKVHWTYFKKCEVRQSKKKKEHAYGCQELVETSCLRIQLPYWQYRGSQLTRQLS